MDWKDIISNRKNTYNWENRIPDKALIDEIVREIHDYCPSKQRKVPFYIDLIDNTEYNYRPIAYKTLLDNKDKIKKSAADFIKEKVNAGEEPFKDYVYDESKCLRDVGYIVSGYANDLRYLTNKNTCNMASGYWKNGVPQVRRAVEIVVHNYLKDLLASLLISNNAEQESVEEIKALTDIIINVIDKGLDVLPTIIPGSGNLRHDIFYGTDRKGNGQANDIRNPQVLAPWLLVFSMRNLNEQEIGLNSEMKDHHKARNVSENEIGLASMFTVLSATSKGLDTGFCACIRNGSEIATRLGHKKEEQVLLYVGIGYGSKSNSYYNPVIHEHLSIPNSDYDNKPDLKTYFNEITL